MKRTNNVTYAMAARRTVARILQLSGSFMEDDGLVKVCFPPEGRDRDALIRVVEAARDGSDAYRKAVAAAARKHLAACKLSVGGDAA